MYNFLLLFLTAAYLYNVTVEISPMTKSTDGKLWILVHTNSNSGYEVRLHAHSAPMNPGQIITFWPEIPIAMHDITGVSIKYKKRNFLKKNSIGIRRVSLSNNSSYERKSFCPNANVLDIYNEQWYTLPSRC